MDRPPEPAAAPAEGRVDVERVSAWMHEVLSRALEEPAPSMTMLSSAEPSLHQVVEPHLATMREHIAIDELPKRSRFRATKRMVLRLARLFTHRQVAFNRAATAGLEETVRQAEACRAAGAGIAPRVEGLEERITALVTDIQSHQNYVEQRLTGLHGSLASLEMSLSDQIDAIQRAEEGLAGLRIQLFDLAQQRASDRTELRSLHSRLDMLLREARRILPDGGDAGPLALAFNRELEGDLAALYAQFEDAFRGSRDEIARRQSAYLDYVYFLKDRSAPVLDLGCGRGEWLDVLREHGIPAYGVDTNKPFVELGLERGLDVRLGDCLEHLEEVAPSSLGAVSAFHVAEHIDLPSLVHLIDDALRAVVPGGLLILETPNPTNLVVGAAAFYLDPTHLKPIHPQFLEFLVRSRGFVDVELRYLNPSAEPPFVAPELENAAQTAAMKRLVDHLNWALFGPQDCAVIGRKAETA